MASVHKKRSLRSLFDLATALGMDVLFECHSKEEIDSIPDKAKIYGINSRKFKTSHNSLRYKASRWLGRLKLSALFGVRDLSTDLDLFRELVTELPRGVVKVAESGITPGTISGVRELGFDTALIGTALLKSPAGVRKTLEAFRDATSPAGAPALSQEQGVADPAR